MHFVEQLAAGDPDSWNEAFLLLWPVAFEVARTRLGGTFPGECEDVAMETLSELLEKCAQISSERELKPLTAAIARNKATDVLRRHLADKRGGNKVQSLDALAEATGGELPYQPHDEFLDRLEVMELQRLLTDLFNGVKKEYRVVLRDHFLEQLSYKEIAENRQIAVGSVGVYVQRGLAELKSIIARRPKLEAELLDMLSDANVVRAVLPLVSALQFEGFDFNRDERSEERTSLPALFFPSERRPSDTRSSISLSVPVPHAPQERLPSDDEKLRMSEETLPTVREMSEAERMVLTDRLEDKFPLPFAKWQVTQEERRQQAEAYQARRIQEEREMRRRDTIVWCILLAILAGLAFGILRFIRWLL